jgi:hypothetical protein
MFTSTFQLTNLTWQCSGLYTVFTVYIPITVLESWVLLDASMHAADDELPSDDSMSAPKRSDMKLHRFLEPLSARGA